MLLVGLGAGLLLEWIVLMIVRRPQLLAQPVARSSHTTPTPTMGGVAIVAVMLVYFAWLTTVDARLGLGFGLAAALLAGVGLWDDLAALSAGFRLVVHTAAAMLLVWTMAPDMPLPMQAVFVIGAVWFINLYNFMDGIDGYAAVQCLVFCLGAQWVGNGVVGWAGDALWLLSGATLGFLAFNWPPARIFMGDVGSGFLGVLIAGLAVYLWLTQNLPLTASLILLSGFWFDATYTLCVRIITGQKFTQAHRLHMYQYAAQRIGHLWTTVIFAAYATIWLIPWAAFCVGRGMLLQIFALCAAILPLAALCWRFGAGRKAEEIQAR